MNEITKKSFLTRVRVISILLVLCIIATAVYTPIYNNSNITKTDLTVCLNEETKHIFEHVYDNTKDIYKYYNYSISSDLKNSDLVFTSDINMIDTSRNYSVEGYSPLVICLKDTKNLNNYLKTVTKEGFLTCSSSKKIKNTSYDVISCDFLRIIEAVINGEDWSDLGGEDKKITIYCPESNTLAGKLFYDFLLITINNGKYPTDNLEQVKEKADLFLSSKNTIQTDVSSKISKLGGILQEEDIYVLFESDLISVTKGEGEISVSYPETTVIKQLYLQYNNNLEETFSEIFSISYLLINYYYYRNSEYPNFDDLGATNYKPLYFNLQEGFNYYELTY